MFFHQQTTKAIFIKKLWKAKTIFPFFHQQTKKRIFFKKIDNKNDIPRNTVENEDFFHKIFLKQRRFPQNIVENQDDFR